MIAAPLVWPYPDLAKVLVLATATPTVGEVASHRDFAIDGDVGVPVGITYHYVFVVGGVDGLSFV